MRHRNFLLFVFAASACGPTRYPADHEGAVGGESGATESGGSTGSTHSTEAGSGGDSGIPAGAPTGGAGAQGGAALGGSSAAAGTTAAGGIATGGATAGGWTGGANSGGSNEPPTDPYAPRAGKFKMVVYSKTGAYRHAASIAAGTVMLENIAAEVGAEPPLVTEENTFLDSLDAYELVFFMNTSGPILSTEEKSKFEAWMKRGGAFCGTHSATDTEFGWLFYQEVIGQHYEGHGPAGTPDSILFEANAADHPAVRGLPNPWARQDEWMLFKKSGQWSLKPGFQILARRASDRHPVVWTREHDSYRSFYTSIGHDADVFKDPAVQQHLTGGILWAVRREHCLALPKPPGCSSP